MFPHPTSRKIARLQAFSRKLLLMRLTPAWELLRKRSREFFSAEQGTCRESWRESREFPGEPRCRCKRSRRLRRTHGAHAPATMVNVGVELTGRNFSALT